MLAGAEEDGVVPSNHNTRETGSWWGNWKWRAEEYDARQRWRRRCDSSSAQHQHIHASKRKWVARASYVALEIFSTLEEQEMVNKVFGNRWRCIMIDGPVFEVAMATTDGSPL